MLESHLRQSTGFTYQAFRLTMDVAVRFVRKDHMEKETWKVSTMYESVLPEPGPAAVK